MAIAFGSEIWLMGVILIFKHLPPSRGDPAEIRIAFQHRPQADGPLWSIFTLEVDTLGRTGGLRKSLPQLMMDMGPSLQVGHLMA